LTLNKRFGETGTGGPKGLSLTAAIDRIGSPGCGAADQKKIRKTEKRLSSEEVERTKMDATLRTEGRKTPSRGPS